MSVWNLMCMCMHACMHVRMHTKGKCSRVFLHACVFAPYICMNILIDLSACQVASVCTYAYMALGLFTLSRSLSLYLRLSASSIHPPTCFCMHPSVYLPIHAHMDHDSLVEAVRQGEACSRSGLTSTCCSNSARATTSPD